MGESMHIAADWTILLAERDQARAELATLQAELDRRRFISNRALATCEKALAERDQARGHLADAIAHASEGWRRAGLAEGKLEASEMAGVVRDWREKALALEAEVERLRRLLTDLAVVVLDHLYDAPALTDHRDDVDTLIDTVFAAAEGGNWTDIEHPWPGGSVP